MKILKGIDPASILEVGDSFPRIHGGVDKSAKPKKPRKRSPKPTAPEYAAKMEL